jgi:hypothetical protein
MGTIDGQKKWAEAMGTIGMHLMLRPSFALDCHYTLHIVIADS